MRYSYHEEHNRIELLFSNADEDLSQIGVSLAGVTFDAATEATPVKPIRNVTPIATFYSLIQSFMLRFLIRAMSLIPKWFYWVQMRRVTSCGCLSTLF